MSNNNGNLTEVGAIWEKESPKAGKFWSGQMSEDVPAGATIMVFRNKNKKSDRHPVAHILTPKPEEEQSQEPEQHSRAATAPPSDDIPF